MLHVDSNTSLTVRPAPSDMNTKIKFNQSPSQAHLGGFHGIIKDQSVTKLGDHPLITDRA